MVSYSLISHASADNPDAPFQSNLKYQNMAATCKICNGAHHSHFCKVPLQATSQDHPNVAHPNTGQTAYQPQTNATGGVGRSRVAVAAGAGPGRTMPVTDSGDGRVRQNTFEEPDTSAIDVRPPVLAAGLWPFLERIVQHRPYSSTCRLQPSF